MKMIIQYYVKKDGRWYYICDDCLKTTDEYGNLSYTITYNTEKLGDSQVHYIVEEVGGDGMNGNEWYGENYYIDWGEGIESNLVEPGVITVPPLYLSDFNEGISEEQNCRAYGYYVYYKNKEKGKAGVKIQKYDKKTNKPLGGAVFVLGVNENGSFVQKTEEVITDENGEAILYVSEPGTYIINELEAPSGYEIDEDKNGKETVKVTEEDIKKETIKSPIKIYNDTRKFSRSSNPIKRPNKRPNKRPIKTYKKTYNSYKRR